MTIPQLPRAGAGHPSPRSSRGRGATRARIELLRPESEWCDSGDVLEVMVGTQHDELVSNAELCEERVDRADLQAAAATVVAKVGRSCVILALRHDQRQRSESIDDLLSRFRAAESLQDLLENQAGREDRPFVLKSVSEKVHAGMALALVTAQGQRPHTGINEELQFRDRAAL